MKRIKFLEEIVENGHGEAYATCPFCRKDLVALDGKIIDSCPHCKGVDNYGFWVEFQIRTAGDFAKAYLKVFSDVELEDVVTEYKNIPVCLVDFGDYAEVRIEDEHGNFGTWRLFWGCPHDVSAGKFLPSGDGVYLSYLDLQEFKSEGFDFAHIEKVGNIPDWIYKEINKIRCKMERIKFSQKIIKYLRGGE